MVQKTLPSDKIIIYRDTRERWVDNFIKNNCDLRVKQLSVADFLLSDDVAVERKTVDDFLSSMISQRLFSQLKDMKKNFANPILLIEGTGIYSRRRIHPNAIRGALASIVVDHGIPILWTTNQHESALLLLSIAKREQSEKKNGVSIRGTRSTLNEHQKLEFLVSGLPEINTILAQRLLKHFKTVEKIFTSSEEELKKVDGIGIILAKKIRKILTRKYTKR